MSKKLFGIFVLLIFAVGLFGCGGGKGGQVTEKYGSVGFSIDLRNIGKQLKFAGPTISKVTATITATDLDPIVVNLVEDQGIWKGTATVRVGKNREIKVDVYDQDNIVIYKNCQVVKIDVVEGQNPVNISLCTVTGEVVINGTVSSGTLSLKTTISGTFSAARTGDVDGDGQNELIVGTSSPSRTCEIQIYEYSGGTYNKVWSSQLTGYNCNGIVADVDTDGKNELIVSADNADDGGTVKIYEHSGGNDYTEAWSGSFASPRGNRELSVGDCDNDGKNELVIGVNWYGRYMVVYEHSGGNNYTEAYRDSLGSDFQSTVVADADDDGLKEIIVGTSNWSTWDLRIYKASGGSYTVSWDTDGIGRVEVAVGDIDGDGKNEILVTTGPDGVEHLGIDNSVRIYKWNGSTYDSTIVNSSSTSAYWKPAIGDVLNKGTNQVVFIVGKSVKIYEYSSGTYNEVWSAELSYENYWGEQETYIGDCDNNGRNNLIVTDNDAGIKIYEN